MRDRISLTDAQQELPRFNIEEKIAFGGQKDVFVGEFEGDEVIVKTVVLEELQHVKRAELEVEVMNDIDSDILVDLKMHFPDKISNQEVLVLVEEFVPGKTLRDHLEENGPSIELGIQVLSTILQVLGEFEDKEYVHRDIKPENIMVEPDGQIRLLDVGVVRALEGSDLTPTDWARSPGTVEYSSPEMLANNKEIQNVRTDFFSLGIVFFECVTGIHPFDIEEFTIQDAIEKGAHRNLTDYVDLSEELEELDNFYEQMISTNLHRRHRTVNIAQTDLNHIIGGTSYAI
ncbi:serine/threonine protein kinase [Halorientalis brevis]|uniref:Serine/threonine protein kinase n=1 Tax=Halorientalis brevis TaxID=1126241 RepID=A0ABD6CEK5_9EURY|nr:protein kinase [Halorientalis brevis]